MSERVHPTSDELRERIAERLFRLSSGHLPPDVFQRLRESPDVRDAHLRLAGELIAAVTPSQPAPDPMMWLRAQIVALMKPERGNGGVGDMLSDQQNAAIRQVLAIIDRAIGAAEVIGKADAPGDHAALIAEARGYRKGDGAPGYGKDLLNRLADALERTNAPRPAITDADIALAASERYGDDEWRRHGFVVGVQWALSRTNAPQAPRAPHRFIPWSEVERGGCAHTCAIDGCGKPASAHGNAHPPAAPEPSAPALPEEPLIVTHLRRVAQRGGRFGAPDADETCELMAYIDALRARASQSEPAQGYEEWLQSDPQRWEDYCNHRDATYDDVRAAWDAGRASQCVGKCDILEAYERERDLNTRLHAQSDGALLARLRERFTAKWRDAKEFQAKARAANLKAGRHEHDYTVGCRVGETDTWEAALGVLAAVLSEHTEEGGR